MGMNIYDFLLGNTIYCTILLQLFVILSFVLFIVSIFFWVKTKKKYWAIVILFALFGIYQIVPHYYEVKAVLATNGDEVVKNYQKAINTSMFSMQKAMLCSSLANYYATRDLSLSLKYYENTYKYTKNYESKYIWVSAIRPYYLSGNYDKVFEINEVLGMDILKSKAYIMKNDFKSALNSVNKQLERKPKSWEALAIRANIYKNLGDEQEANQDYKKALSLCANEQSRNKVNEYYQNKSAISDEWILKRNAIKEKGVNL
jgi:tetratricopeptide (TPR) repeat protein